MNTSCSCFEMPSIFYHEDAEKAFYEHLEKVDSSDWYELYKCKTSGQYWRIDVWQWGGECFVAKIEDVKNWKVFDIVPLIKDLMIKNRGGTTEQKCIWVNCMNKRVKGVAYCINHLYETGVRR